MVSVKRPPWSRSRTFLREWRKFRDMTQEYVAAEIEVDNTTLSKIERGLVPYNQDLLEKLALIYGCDPGDLLNNDPTRMDAPKLVYDQLQAAPPEVRERALAVIQALMKAG